MLNLAIEVKFAYKTKLAIATSVDDRYLAK